MKPVPQAIPPVRAVVFDLDGLMFNTEEIFNRTEQEMLRRRGKELTGELLMQMMGRRPHEALALMIEMLDLKDTVEELWVESQATFQELLPGNLRPMPGLFELLDCIEDRRLPKAVASSSPHDYLHDILDRFDLRQRFAFTLAAEDVTHGKPHPEIYEKAAATIGVPAERMLVLEDSQAGTQAAAAAGAIVVSVPHTHSRGHDFSGAAFIANRLDDPRVFKLLH